MARWLTRSGAMYAVSSAINEPMLWPISMALAAPAASSTANIQRASSATLSFAVPRLRPWPGKSTASTFQPWWAK